MAEADEFDVLLNMLAGIAPPCANSPQLELSFIQEPAWSTSEQQETLLKSAPSATPSFISLPAPNKRADTGKQKAKPARGKAKVRELEKQLAEQEAILQRLQINNAFLNTRVQMLELVIAVRDQQVQRVQSIKDGLNFNPFGPALGHTMQEIRALGAPWVGKWYLHQMTGLAQKLALIQPYLTKYPFLRWGPDPHTRWPVYKVRVGRNGELAPPLGHAQLTPPAYTGPWDKHVQEELRPVVLACQDLLSAYDDTLMAYQFKLFMFPDASFTDGLNILTAAHSTPRAFDELASHVTQSHQQGQGQQGGSHKHALAPDYFQAAVLYDIFAQGQSGVVQQRKSLAAAMDMLQTSAMSGSSVSSSLASDYTSSMDSPLDRWVSSARTEVPSPRVDAAGVAWKSADVLQQEANLLKQLQLTIVKEGCLDSLISEAWRFHMLSPIQLAIVFVESYPFFPDMPALLRAATEQYKLMRKGTSALP